MEVKEFQKRIEDHLTAWERNRSVKYTEQLSFAHLVEEVGELATEYVNKEARKDEYSI